MPLALQSIEEMGVLALTVIPLLCLYFGLIAWLTFDAAQDSNWFFWLVLFLAAGPISIPLYVFVARRARRSTPQHVLDAQAEEKRQSPYKFGSEIDRFKWIQGLDPQQGTMYEPAVGLSIPRSRDKRFGFRDARAEELLAAQAPEAGAYIRDMLEIAEEQGQVDRVAYYSSCLASLPADAPAPVPTEVQPPAPPPRSGPF